MAASPQFKVYDASGTYQAACKEPEAAACLAALYGDAASVRWDHTVVLLRGNEASDSYDVAAELIYARMAEHRANVAARRAARSTKPVGEAV